MTKTTTRAAASRVSCYESKMAIKKRRGAHAGGERDGCRKRWRSAAAEKGASTACHDFFHGLPDDLVLSVLCKLGTSASCPSDIANVLITCKRLNRLGTTPHVLAKASPKALAMKANNWSDSAHRFLNLCADAGNAEACYILGMIRFYCLQNRGAGAALMAQAAIASHAPALYSLAVIHFNGSGGGKGDKDLRAGVALCARAAFLGHVDALRELGHCLQDGYGVRQNIPEGRRFLIQANARELASVLGAGADKHPTTTSKAAEDHHGVVVCADGGGCPLLSDFGCDVPHREPDPANRFMVEWYGGRAGEDVGAELRLCSYGGCGRPETRRHEFRRCSVCGAVNYCSRACQAMDWKVRHKAECTPPAQWAINDDGAGDDEEDVGEEELDDNTVVEEEQ